MHSCILQVCPRNVGTRICRRASHPENPIDLRRLILSVVLDANPKSPNRRRGSRECLPFCSVAQGAREYVLPKTLKPRLREVRYSPGLRVYIAVSAVQDQFLLSQIKVITGSITRRRFDLPEIITLASACSRRSLHSRSTTFDVLCGVSCARSRRIALVCNSELYQKSHGQNAKKKKQRRRQSYHAATPG